MNPCLVHAKNSVEQKIHLILGDMADKKCSLSQGNTTDFTNYESCVLKFSVIFWSSGPVRRYLRLTNITVAE